MIADGIIGACGGVCSRATCHIRVKPEWVDRVGCPGEDEKDLLELEDGADERSRLSCQIEMTDELDGLVVEVAPSVETPVNKSVDVQVPLPRPICRKTQGGSGHADGVRW